MPRAVLKEKALTDQLQRHLLQDHLAVKELRPETPAVSRRALLDGQIDEAVYDLYGLTEAERRLVEEAVGR